jgi:hypothetical protein
MLVSGTASEPCTMKKGVNPMAQLGVVHRLHSTDDSLATHLARKLVEPLEYSWLQAL